MLGTEFLVWYLGALMGFSLLGFGVLALWWVLGP